MNSLKDSHLATLLKSGLFLVLTISSKATKVLYSCGWKDSNKANVEFSNGRQLKYGAEDLYSTRTKGLRASLMSSGSSKPFFPCRIYEDHKRREKDWLRS